MEKMKDSGIEWIGDIPEDWSVIRLKHSAWLKGRIGWQGLRSDEFKEEGPYLITGTDFDNGIVNWNTCVHITESRFREAPEIHIHEDDLLITKDGTIGKTAIAKNCPEKVSLNSGVFIVRNTGKYKYVSKFLYYIIQSNEFTLWFDLGNVGNSTIKHLNQEMFYNFQFALPPLETQKRIADFLDAKCAKIDGLKNDIQKQIETLEQYKKSVITEAVTGKLKFASINPNAKMKDSGIEWIGKIPEHWEVKRIGQIYIERREKVSDRDYPPLSVTMKGILPQLETAAKSDAHDDRKLVCKGDFAINSRSDRRGSCGISPCDGSISLINTVLIPLGKMHPVFYNWLFHTPIFADEFYKNGHGIVDDLWTTSWQEMKRISIPLPSMNEQKQIADYLDEKCSSIDSIISTKKQQLEKLEEYKKSLIFEYVTGKKQVFSGEFPSETSGKKGVV